MTEVWVLYVLLSLPPPGIVTGWSQPYGTERDCQIAAARAHLEDMFKRTGEERALLVTHCVRMK